MGSISSSGKPLQCHVKHIDADHVKHVTLFAKHQGELVSVEFLQNFHSIRFISY